MFTMLFKPNHDISWVPHRRSEGSNFNIPISIKDNILALFSEHIAPIGTYDTPIDSDFHGDGPCKIWSRGIDRVLSTGTI